jgi:hypothetical protein
MTRKKRHPVKGPQETVSATQFFAEVLGLPSTAPMYNKHPINRYLYVCLQCGWWTISSSVDTVFGSFVGKPGPRTEPCERCQRTPMYLVQREDLLHVVIESRQEETHS